MVLGPERDALMLAVTDGCDGREVERIVRAAPWPRRLERELTRCSRFLEQERLFSVRSSVVGEDSARASHAGQFATLLDVGLRDVVEAVRTCWSSALAARAVHYRRRRGVTGVWPRIAVIAPTYAYL